MIDYEKMLTNTNFRKDSLLKAAQLKVNDNIFPRIRATIAEIYKIIDENTEQSNILTSFYDIVDQLDTLLKLQEQSDTNQDVYEQSRLSVINLLSELSLEMPERLMSQEFAASPHNRPQEAKNLGDRYESVLLDFVEELSLILLDYHAQILSQIPYIDNVPDLYVPFKILEERMTPRARDFFAKIYPGKQSFKILIQNLGITGINPDSIQLNEINSLMRSEYFNDLPNQMVDCIKFDKFWGAIIWYLGQSEGWNIINSKLPAIFQNVRIAYEMRGERDKEAKQRSAIIKSLLFYSIFPDNIENRWLRINGLLLDDKTIKAIVFITNIFLPGKLEVDEKGVKIWLQRLFSSRRGKDYDLNGITYDPSTKKLRVNPDINVELISKLNKKIKKFLTHDSTLHLATIIELRSLLENLAEGEGI